MAGTRTRAIAPFLPLMKTFDAKISFLEKITPPAARKGPSVFADEVSPTHVDALHARWRPIALIARVQHLLWSRRALAGSALPTARILGST